MCIRDRCYKALGLVPAKIKEYSNEANPLNKVMLGLLYIENGDLCRGIIILDEFTMSEPDLLITRGIKPYIKQVVKQINQQ